jgi:peptide/nickel transport system substrate-binding protein
MLTGYQGKYRFLVGIFLIVFLLSKCSIGGEGSATQTPTVEEWTQASPEASGTPTAEPTPTSPPRTLTICMGSEPESLYIYSGSSLAQRNILEAIYDGPVDLVGYQYQPVILEKLPSLVDGDASLEPVPVQSGDWVVNNAGHLVRIDMGEVVRPYGCNSSDCAVTWDGGELEMPQLSATFILKGGIKWSDSTPLIAADSVFSFSIARQCQSESGPCGGLGLVTRQGGETLQRTASYVALDDLRVQWKGVPGFLDPAYQTNFFIPLPEHQLSQFTTEELFIARESAQLPLGWGPYTIIDWVPDEFISLRANPLYFRSGEATPKFDQLLFRFIGQGSDRNLEFLHSGACDLLDQNASLAFLEGEIEQLLALEDDGQLQAHFTAGPVWEHVDFGIRPVTYDDGYQLGIDRPDFFGDVRVRQAFAMCIDRQKIVADILYGQSLVPDTYLPPEHPLFNANISRYGFDPLAASQLLDEAGWVDDDGDPETPRVARGIQGVADGTPLTVTFTTSNALQRQQASQILADSLAGCGIRIDLQYGPAEEVFAPGPEGLVFGRRFDLAQLAWSSGVLPPCHLWTSQQIPGDPSLKDDNGIALFPYGWGGVNETGFSNPEYDRACYQALETLPGDPEFHQNHHAAQAIFADQLPVIALYQRLKLALTRSDMCGFSLDASSYSEVWNIESFDYGEECP